jgi:light-regulated signal transduction histidine kinase (bacteriophytochrome)
MAPQPEMNRQEMIAAQALLSGLTELSARATHDLLGPLNQAGSLLTLFVKRYRGRLDPDADTLVEFLESASLRMESVIAGVRSYMEIASRPQSVGPVDLNSSLASSRALLERAVSASGAVIVSDSLPVVSADAVQMVKVFEILIGNSIKFRRPDAPPHIEVRSIGTGGVRGIKIADNGIGIDPQYREAVFLPFRRLNGREYEGNGLGLAMAKLIVELHGGNIGIDPAPSGGTHVKFTVRPA